MSIRGRSLHFHRFTPRPWPAGLILAGIPLVVLHPVLAQETPAAPPETAPAAESAAPADAPAVTTPEPAVTPAPAETPAPDEPDSKPRTTVNSSKDLPAPAAQPSKLTAARVAYDGGLIIAEGTDEEPVRFETSAGRLFAHKIILDTVKRTVEAHGQVRLEREVIVARRELRASSLPIRRRNERVRETATGENLTYDFDKQQGHLDSAYLQVSGFTLTAEALEINGKRYTARNLILLPGGMTPEERKIYGTPPLNLHAKEVTVVTGDRPADTRIVVKGAGLFFKNTKLLPVPSYVANTVQGTGNRDKQAFSITPTIGYNSADNLLLTTRFRFPLSQDGDRLAALADIGLSQRVGLRGGASLVSNSNAGQFALKIRRSDIVTTQLTNRIELDRYPEATYESPYFLRVGLPGKREAGLRFNASYGEFQERTIGSDEGKVKSARSLVGVNFTTRLNPVDGPYLELFATLSDYSKFADDYRNLGFEVGYEGNLVRNVRGQVSYRSSSLQGDTPFRFDEVEIARELRGTVDIQVTKRYIVPLDLRYDLSRHEFRDKTFGILRSYKYFAYGVVYQTARKDLRLEVRQAF